MQRSRPRRGFALGLLVVACALLAVVLVTGVSSGAAAAPSVRVTSSVPGLPSAGDKVQVRVHDVEGDALSARQCNLDPALAIDETGCAGAFPVSVRAGVASFPMTMRAGVLGLDPRSVCPPTREQRADGVECGVVVQDEAARVLAVAAVPMDETLDQHIGVDVINPADVEPGEELPPVTATPVTGVSGEDVEVAGAREVPGGGGPEALATTGPSRTALLAIVGFALCDLGYLCWSSTRARRRPRWAVATWGGGP